MENKIGKSALVYRLFKGLIISFIALLFLSFGFLMAGANDIFLMLLLIVVVFVSVIMFLEYNNLDYKIESNSITFKQGILSLKTITVPYIRITNISFDQSPFQRLFSVGTISIDQEDSDFEWKDIDSRTANKLLQEVSAKSNIQPVSNTISK